MQAKEINYKREVAGVVLASRIENVYRKQNTLEQKLHQINGSFLGNLDFCQHCSVLPFSRINIQIVPNLSELFNILLNTVFLVVLNREAPIFH